MRCPGRQFVFLLTCIMLIGTCTLSFADDAAGNGAPRYFALLVGNGEYLDENMEPLPETTTGVSAMKAALESMNPAWSVVEAYNIAGREFALVMEETFRDVSEGDVCLFYYAGHGSFDADNYPGALKGIDANTLKENYADAFMTVKELGDTLSRLCPGEVIVILDSCGSGSAIWNGEPLEGLESSVTDMELLNSDDMTRVGDLRREGFTVLAACEHGDWAYPFPDDDPRRSLVFTYCILQAMGCTPEGAYTGTIPADADGDGKHTLGEVTDYTRTLHEELRETLPDDFPFQIFQFCGKEDTVLFSR